MLYDYIFLTTAFIGAICLLSSLFILYVSVKFRDSKNYFLCLLFSFVFLLCSYTCYEMKHKDLSDLRYENIYEDLKCDVEVKKIIKEKGKKTEYIVSTFYGETTIPETIYEEYIGHGNNTITLKMAEINIYIGRTYPFGIATQFSGEEKALRFVRESKYYWPWEEAIAPFTVQEARELALVYLDGHIKPNGSCFTDISEDVKPFK